MMKVIARQLRLVTLITVGWGLQAQAQPTDFSLPPLPNMATNNPSGLTGSMPPLPNSPIAPNSGAKKDTSTPAKVANLLAPVAFPELANLPTPTDPAAAEATAEATPPVIDESTDTVASDNTSGDPVESAPPALAVSAPPATLPGLDFPVAPPPGTTKTASANALPSSPTSLPEVSVDAPAAPKVRTWKTTLAPAVVPPRTTFNYRRQILPDAIYRKQYDRENAHLPLQVTREDYAQLLIQRVASNDLNGTRALLNEGLSVNTTDGSGQTLLSVARRTGARDTERLLIARGAS